MIGVYILMIPWGIPGGILKYRVEVVLICTDSGLSNQSKIDVVLTRNDICAVIPELCN